MSQHLGFSVDIENPIADQLFSMSMTDRIIPGTFRVNRKGVSFAVYMDSIEASRYISAPMAYRVVVTRLGQPSYYQLSTPKAAGDRVQFQASSPESTLDNLEYTRLWSHAGVAGWRLLEETELATSVPTWYNTDQRDRLYGALKNNTTYDYNVQLLQWAYEIDIRQTAGLVGVSFEVRYRLPQNAELRIDRSPHGPVYSNLGTLATHTIFGAGAGAGTTPTQSSMIAHFSANPADVLTIRLLPNLNPVTPLATGAANPEGTWFIEITNIRIVSSVDMAVDTALTAGPAAGTNALITVANTAKMIPGQEVYIGVFGDQGGERTIVNSIVSTTQFRADLTLGHATPNHVKTLRIAEREIIADMAAALTFPGRDHVYPYWVYDKIAFVQNAGVDLENAAWIGASPRDVLAALAKAPSYTYGVNRQGHIYFYPPGQNSRAWAVDASAIEIGRPIKGSARQVYNRVQVLYRDQDGYPQITPIAEDLLSQDQQGVIRQHVLTIDTTSDATALAARDISLLDTTDRPIESGIQCAYLMNLLGGIVPADSADDGDLITIRNTSMTWDDPALSDITIYEVEIDAENGQPTIVPQAPLARLDRFLARIPQGFTKV